MASRVVNWMAWAGPLHLITHCNGIHCVALGLCTRGSPCDSAGQLPFPELEASLVSLVLRSIIWDLKTERRTQWVALLSSAYFLLAPVVSSCPLGATSSPSFMIRDQYLKNSHTASVSWGLLPQPREGKTSQTGSSKFLSVGLPVCVP